MNKKGSSNYEKEINTNKKLIYSKREISEYIEKLFENLWPIMNGKEKSRNACYQHIDVIISKFNNYSNNFDKLLDSLCAIDGLGPVISSGLIFIAFQNEAVPFDKYTMTYCLNNKILISNKITGNRYLAACEKTQKYIDKHPTINSIIDLVRIANSTEPILGPE